MSTSGHEGTTVNEQEQRLKGWSWIWINVFKCPVAVVWSILLEIVLLCPATLALFGYAICFFLGSGHYMLCYAAFLNPLEKKIMQEYRSTGLEINAIVTRRDTIMSADTNPVVTSYVKMQYNSPDGPSKYQLCFTGSCFTDQRQVELLVLLNHMASGYPALKTNPDASRYGTQERFCSFVGGFGVMAFYIFYISFIFDGWVRYVCLAVYVGTIPVAVPVLSRRLRHKYNNYAVLVADDTPRWAGGEMHRNGNDWQTRLYITCVHSIERVLCPCLTYRLYRHTYCLDQDHTYPPLEEECAGGFKRVSIPPV